MQTVTTESQSITVKHNPAHNDTRLQAAFELPLAVVHTDTTKYGPHGRSHALRCNELVQSCVQTLR